MYSRNTYPFSVQQCCTGTSFTYQNQEGSIKPDFLETGYSSNEIACQTDHVAAIHSYGVFKKIRPAFHRFTIGKLAVRFHSPVFGRELHNTAAARAENFNVRENHDLVRFTFPGKGINAPKEHDTIRV